MHNRTAQIIAALVVVLVGVAVAWSILSGPGRPRVLPQGVQTLTGTLIPAELSLERRGTHMLKVDGEDVAYVESPSVNLRQFELTEVVVTGTFRLNTDPSDVPVLIVSSVSAVEIPAETVLIPSLGLTLRVPATWEMQEFDDGVAFAFTGSTTPFLRVARSSLTRLPEGTPMFIGGYDAVRVDGAAGQQTVHVEGGRSIVTFVWTGSSDESPAFAQMLRTVVIRSAPDSSSSQSGTVVSSASSAPAFFSSSAGSAAASIKTGQPCGGPAGILCGPGTYCAVNSPDGVGTCVAL